MTALHSPSGSFRGKRLSHFVNLLSLILFGDVVVANKSVEFGRAGHGPTHQVDNTSSVGRYSILNMTCSYFEQPLNHFDLPRGVSPSFKQRYCVYNDFMVNPANATIFLYTGNESPLEIYINSTGLMWELAEAMNAQIVFVEHRYEGKSLPSPDIPRCMAYASSIQALADYARFIESNLYAASVSFDPITGDRKHLARPVIVFGGSYGGMLSAWMRMKYPNLVAGAIAASAPIWGFPRNFPNKIDAAWQVIYRGLQLSYPPTEGKEDGNQCASNLLATWPLMKVLGNSSLGRELLQESFRLCDALEDIDSLIDWAQSPWFDLAEGSFPYPSGYIPFALTHNDQVQLPAWPLQAACWIFSDLYEDHGIHFEGNLSKVLYNITYKDFGITIMIDWDSAKPEFSLEEQQIESIRESDFLGNVRDAVSIWFNITKDVTCYDLHAAPNLARLGRMRLSKKMMQKPRTDFPVTNARSLQGKDSAAQCQSKMADGSWPSLCCNEEMELIITESRGLGADFLWPPSHPRGTKSHGDVVALENNETYAYCRDPDDIFGFPQDAADRWATWMDTYYGGLRIQSHSNIIFSNGLLDPWSAAGVYSSDPLTSSATRRSMLNDDDDDGGLILQNVTDWILAVIMPNGGHHTDLMYGSKLDPPDIRRARQVEAAAIQNWIKEWWVQNM